jgi:hypothetical protein
MLIQIAYLHRHGNLGVFVGKVKKLRHLISNWHRQIFVGGGFFDDIKRKRSF